MDFDVETTRRLLLFSVPLVVYVVFVRLVVYGGKSPPRLVVNTKGFYRRLLGLILGMLPVILAAYAALVLGLPNSLYEVFIDTMAVSLGCSLVWLFEATRLEAATKQSKNDSKTVGE
jgi:hypothetical protein